MTPTLLLACAHLPVAPVRTEVEAVLQVALRSGDAVVAGLAAVRVGADAFELELMPGAGSSVLTVRGGAGPLPDHVITVSAELADTLARVPFGRDLRAALLWRCEPGVDRCSAGDGVLVTRPGGLEWRGPSGPVTLTWAPGGALVEDRLRPYTLQLVGPEVVP